MFMPILLLLCWTSLVAGVAWWLSGALAALLAALSVVILGFVVTVWRLQRLERWLSGPDLTRDVAWRGLWREIAQRIQRLIKQRDKQVAAHEQRLQHFLQL